MTFGGRWSLQSLVPMCISSVRGRGHIGIPGVHIWAHGVARIPALSHSPALEGMSMWRQRLWGREVLPHVNAGCHKVAWMLWVVGFGARCLGLPINDRSVMCGSMWDTIKLDVYRIRGKGEGVPQAPCSCQCVVSVWGWSAASAKGHGGARLPPPPPCRVPQFSGRFLQLQGPVCVVGVIEI